MADGCSKNLSASNKFTTLLGLLSPGMCCAVQAADGSIKRLTNAKTRSVPGVSEFLPSLRSILRHFQLSGRSTAMLNDALEGLDMKTTHVILFCLTRMPYILTACKQTVVNLVPLYDVIATANLKPEENADFMSPEDMIILHLLAAVESVFLKYFLKVLDKYNSLTVSVYHTSLAFIEKIETEFNSDHLNTFLNSISEDVSGNVITQIRVSSDQSRHTITLNYTHRPSRNQTLHKVDSIRSMAEKLKDSLSKNIIRNLRTSPRVRPS